MPWTAVGQLRCRTPSSTQPTGHDNDTSWQIRDVYLAGTISELATRRSDFTATLRSGGIEALILRLNKKVDDLLG